MSIAGGAARQPAVHVPAVIGWPIRQVNSQAAAPTVTKPVRFAKKGFTLKKRNERCPVCQICTHWQIFCRSVYLLHCVTNGAADSFVVSRIDSRLSTKLLPREGKPESRAAENLVRNSWVWHLLADYIGGILQESLVQV